MGWTAAGADEAFLWLDRNHNGKVTSGAELFGNFTSLCRTATSPRTVSKRSASSDTNGDSVIDNRDPVWSLLMLWRDTTHNGISEPNKTHADRGKWRHLNRSQCITGQDRNDTLGNIVQI